LQKNVCFAKNKTTNKKHGELPAKIAKENPWGTLCVDLISPCKTEQKGESNLKPWCLTMIDPATGWFKMEQIQNKTATKAADTRKSMWFAQCPLPQ
jgi:hypothetical protein